MRCVLFASVLFIAVSLAYSLNIDEAVGAIPSPITAANKPVRPEPEDAILARLQQADVDDSERVVLLQSLAQFQQSPSVVKELICWLEFQPLNGGGSPDHPSRRLHRDTLAKDYPAVGVLFEIGLYSIPSVVDEYLFFFDNTSLDARKGRWSHLTADADCRVHEKQSPLHRLALLRGVLTHTSEAGRVTVGYVHQRMATAQQDARLQRAGRALIEDIITSFPAERRAELFPGVNLPR